MSPHDLQNCRAGLDRIPTLPDLCVSTFTTSATFDGSPYVSVVATAKPNTPIGRDRPPLVDKSRDYNVTSKHDISDTLYFQPEFFVQRDVNDLRAIMDGPHLKSTSFHPIPPLPFASSLQLPSFLDFSLTTIPAFRGVIVADSPSRPCLHALQPNPARRINEVEAAHPPVSEAFVTIPAAVHPNSPYVPWASQVRQEILQPSTPASHMSGASDCYSRPLSRTGAQAPEPMYFPPELSPRNGSKFPKVSKSIRNLKLAVKKTVAQAAKCIMRLKKTHSSNSKVQLHRNDNTQTVQSRFSNRVSASAASFESSETNTLAMWLESRQNAARERGREAPHYASLDEYERAGSWMDLAGDSSTTKALCHLKQTSNPIRIDTSLSHRPFSMSWLQEGHSLSCPSTPIRIHPRSKSPVYGDSDLLRSLDLMHRHTQSPRSVTSTRDLELSGGKMRELNMPGGWSFNY